MVSNGAVLSLKVTNLTEAIGGTGKDGKGFQAHGCSDGNKLDAMMPLTV
jgi:hypothetical protein